MPAFQQVFPFVRAGTEQVSLITLTMSLFYLSVSVSHGSVTVNEQETEAAKRNSAIIFFIVFFCAFPPECP